MAYKWLSGGRAAASREYGTAACSATTTPDAVASASFWIGLRNIYDAAVLCAATALGVYPQILAEHLEVG